ncbi:hypothetical protein [Methylocapsa aurea]|uniref:hypothetical protein n=1 Tax=Methylocapsa aurea TaxID=663610 RepID=UPI003D188257
MGFGYIIEKYEKAIRSVKSSVTPVAADAPPAEPSSQKPRSLLLAAGRAGGASKVDASAMDFGHEPHCAAAASNLFN